MDSTLRKSLLFMGILGLFSGVAATANGDDSAAPADKAERIEVTGSHIKRVDVEGVSAVETVTKAQIEKKGYDNLGDVVKDLGVNSFGGGTVSGNSSTPGNADINLRGLGSDNTLVLLNGQRLPQDAITGTVDINLIPMAAVERIEILKDGASAIYGSDALGGVVNIITRKDFEGTEISLSQSLPNNYSDGKRTQIDVVNGINTEKLNVVTTLDYRYDQAIFSKNRPWSSNGYSTFGNPPSYANDTGGTPGTYQTTANCPPSLLITTPGGTFCRYKFSDNSEEAPLISQISAMSEAHLELNSQIKLFSRLSYSHRYAQMIAAPPPGVFTIPASTAGTFNPPGWDGTSPLDLKFRLTPLGNRDTEVTSNAYGVLAGATIQLPKDWQMDVTLSNDWVTSHSQGTHGFALIDSMQNLMASGSVDPFAAPGAQGDFSSASYVPFEDTKTILNTIEAKASGDIAEYRQGPISLAIGSLVSYSDYADHTDQETLNGNVFGNAGSAGGGHRTSEALYSEISIPLVKKKLDLQVAGRFDHYSDFGSTVNPKVGILYRPSSSWLLRGSWGTGFRAPLLSELYAGQSIGNPTFIDYVACKAHPGTSDCEAQQYQVTSGGNPNLKQETSTSYTFGAIFAPTPSFNVGTDWFYTKISNQPGIDYNDMTQAEANGADPSQNGVIITRDSNKEIVNVVAPLQNLSSTEEFGVDVTASYTFKRFKLSTEQNELFFYKTTGFPGVTAQDKLGWYGLPRWRNTTSLDYFVGDQGDITAAARTIPGQQTLDKSGNISSLTTFDLSYVYKTKKIGSFSVGVINILGSLPPIDASQPTSPVNYSLYDANGRQFVLGYKVKI